MLKNLKFGVVVIEGVSAVIGLGLTIYQLVKVINEESKANKRKSAIDVTDDTVIEVVTN